MSKPDLFGDEAPAGPGDAGAAASAAPGGRGARGGFAPDASAPLAERLRPRSIDEVIGQQHLLGTGKPLRVAFESGKPHSMIFWGPPGVGKTTLARLMADAFDAHFLAISAVLGGVSLPWNLALAAQIGLLLLFTRPLLGAEGTLAHVHHVIGSLVLTVVSISAAEVARPARWLNLLLGITLAASAVLLQADALNMVVSVLLGVALMGVSIRRGPIIERYGDWSRLLV